MTSNDKLAFAVCGTLIFLSIAVIGALIFVPSFDAAKAYAAGAIVGSLVTMVGVILGLSKTRQLDRERSGGGNGTF